MRKPAHRKTVKHYHQPGDLHEFTFSCYQRRQLLGNDAWRATFARFVEVSGEEYHFDLVAFVFMPEHVHLLTFPTDPAPDIPGYLGSMKQRMSKTIKEDLARQRSSLLRNLTVRERPGRYVFRYWQEGPGYDRNMQTPDAVINAIEYIHANPVRRRLVKANRQWAWSSARFYETEGKEHDSRCPKVTPLPAEYFQGYWGTKELPG